jgi:hypothetical protein
MDSTDIAIERGKDRGRKSDYWSGKLKRPGVRVMFIRDANGIVRKLWGWYSPKVYDAHFVDLQQEWFEEALHDAIVIADAHFRSAAYTLKNPKLVTNIPKRKKRKHGEDDDEEEDEIGEDAEGLAVETKKRSITNITLIFARAERPFGNLKVKFDVFDNPWAEDLTQLKYLVFYVNTAELVW